MVPPYFGSMRWSKTKLMGRHSTLEVAAAMVKVLFLLPFATLLSLAGPARAEEEHGFWWYQEAKVACMGDVMRLCRSFVPDEDKVRACMKDKKTQVSESCAEFYPGGAKAN